MKKYFTLLTLLALITGSFTSCVATKKDCQGVKHTRLKNGIYI
jgi:hypothetical protein